MKKLKILYIDDNPMDKALVRDSLERKHGGFELYEASSQSEFETLLQDEKFDLVLSDFNILGFEGLQVIDYVKTNFPLMPVIIVTGTGSEEIAVEAMKRSAADYIIKSPRHIQKLPYSIEKAIVNARLQITQTIIANVTRAVLHTHNLKQLGFVIQSELGKLIDTRNFFIALLDEKGENFQLVYCDDEKDDSADFPVAKTISHYVIRNKKPLLASLDELIELEKQGEIQRIGSDCLIWMGIPLHINKHIIGVMVIQSYEDRFAYSKDDLQLLTQIAAPLSLAIQGKKRREELEELNRLLSKKNEELREKIEVINRYNEELKTAKEKAEQSDRLKSAFLANMSHEVRTPMNGILGFLELLRDDSISKEERKEFIDIIDNSGKRLLRTINDIIEISKIEAGSVELKLKQFDLCELVKQQYTFFGLKAKEKGLHFELELPALPVNIISDKDKVESIINNLVSNALKFTSEGHVTIKLQKLSSSIVLQVEDSGKGIQPQNLQKIFGRFMQESEELDRGYEGSGLGLAIVSNYAQMLSGTVKVESEPNKGSTFTVELPIVSSPK